MKRSRAVCGQRRVVGVVGQGHLNGVMNAIAKDIGGETLIFKELVGSAESRGRSNSSEGLRSLVQRVVLETVAGFGMWELYKIWKAYES
ncbi:unnamed protein product [Choristocarpus tenellus]